MFYASTFVLQAELIYGNLFGTFFSKEQCGSGTHFWVLGKEEIYNLGK